MMNQSSSSKVANLSTLPPLPPLPQSLLSSTNTTKYEFKITGHFPSQFTNIQSQCYHPSQQVLILGGRNGNLYFIGGDAHYYITLSDEYSIDAIQVDDQFPIIYCLCKTTTTSNNQQHQQQSILVSYDYLKKQIANQVHFQDHHQVSDIKYYKGYLLVTTRETKNNMLSIPYVRYMSTSNFKFIQPITLIHPIFNQLSNIAGGAGSGGGGGGVLPNIYSNLLINCVEPHPIYDHVISVGYSNGETVIYYIYHVQQQNSISTNMNCIVIPSTTTTTSGTVSVTSLNWHSPNIIICGYSNGSFTLYEINHPTFTFSIYYEMNMLKGCTNFITSYNQYIIFALGPSNNDSNSSSGDDSGIYYLKMNYEVKNVEFIRHVWCDPNHSIIENVTLLKSVFDNPSSNSLMSSVIYGKDRNVLVLDLFEKMIHPQKEVQLFNLEKYSVPTPFYSTSDLISDNFEFISLKTSKLELSNLIYNTLLSNYNQDFYRKNMFEYYLRPLHRWNILGMKYSQYKTNVNEKLDENDENFILARLSSTSSSDDTSEMGSALELYKCNSYFNDVRYIYSIGNQCGFRTMCRWSDSVIVLATVEGKLEFLHVPSARIFTHDEDGMDQLTRSSSPITPIVDSSSGIGGGNNFQGIISQIVKYNANNNNNMKFISSGYDNPIIKIFPIQIIDQMVIAYQDGTIRVVTLQQFQSASSADNHHMEEENEIHNNNHQFANSTIFELLPSNMKSNNFFTKSILPKKGDQLSHIESSIYRGNLYLFLAFKSGKLILIQLYDLDYLTTSKNVAKLMKFTTEQKWKEFSDQISPFVIYENSSSNYGKVIDMVTVNDIYGEYNISKMIDDRYLPPRLRSEFIPNSMINQSSTQSQQSPIICYTIYSNSLTNVFGTVKNNQIGFPINSRNPLCIIFQLYKSLSISFSFSLDILNITFETLSKIDEMANYRIVVNGIQFEFDIQANQKIVNGDQLAIVVTGEEYRIYVRSSSKDESGKFECIGSAPSNGINCIQDQYITNMNFKMISHSIHDREASIVSNNENESSSKNSKLYNLCDVDYLCDYIKNVEIYNNLSYSDIHNTKMKLPPNIVATVSKAGIPPLGQAHHSGGGGGYSRSKYIIVVREKGIEEYILEKPMISLKKFSVKEGRRYQHSNIISSSSLESIPGTNSSSKSLMLLDNQNNLMIVSLKPSQVSSKTFEKIFTQQVSSIPHSNQSFKPYKLSSFENGRNVLIYNNDNIVFGTLFDSNHHKSFDMLEPIIYTIDYKPPTGKAIGESIVGFLKSFTKSSSTPNDKDLNETFWKICSQLQREDLNLVKQLVVNNIGGGNSSASTTTTTSGNGVVDDENEKTIVSSFLAKELELQNKPIVKSNSSSSNTTQQQQSSTNPQQTSSGGGNSSSSGGNMPSSSSSGNNLYTKTNRELLFGDDNEGGGAGASSGQQKQQQMDGDATIKITSSNSSMKRSELNNRIEETKRQMNENLRKLNEREEKLKEIGEKTSQMSSVASSFSANAQKLNQRSGFFGF